MNKKPVARFEFKLNEAIDADIIEFMEKDSRTNIGIFREAVRLLIQVEKGTQPLNEAAIVDVIKNTVNEELLGGIIRNVMSEYELTNLKKTDKPRKAFGFKGKSL